MNLIYVQIWCIILLTFSTIIFCFFVFFVLFQFFGMMTKPLIGILLPQPKYTMSMLSSEPSSPKSFTVPLLTNDDPNSHSQSQSHSHSPLGLFLRIPAHTVHHYWRRFDDAFMRPVFGGRGFVPFVPGSPTEDPNQQWQTEGPLEAAVDDNKTILIQTRW